MTVNNVNGTSGNTNFVDAGKTGFAGITSQDFMKLLITQLQNQDPLQPTDNEQLLNQISSMRELTSNIELESTLKSMTANQQLSSAAALIGQTVTGVTDDELEITGMVEQVFLKNGAVYLGVDGEELPLKNVSTIRAAA